MPEEREQIIWGRHAVLEALRAGRSIQRLLLAQGARGAEIDEIFARARQAHIPYDVRGRDHLDRRAPGRHQGVVAYVAARPYADFAAVLARLEPASALLVFLDQIEDPHNLGAIARSAHASGADAVVVPRRRACGWTPAAVKAAAGAAEHLPVCRVDNLQKALQRVRDLGIWVVGLDAAAARPIYEIDCVRGCALVVGSEARGLRRLVAARCDALAHIPMTGAAVGSFNASVAAGIALYEVLRQRRP